MKCSKASKYQSGIRLSQRSSLRQSSCAKATEDMGFGGRHALNPFGKPQGKAKADNLRLMSKKGFTIVEWLISFFLVIFITTCLFQFSAFIHSKIGDISKESNMLTETFSALDTMARKIHCAPCHVDNWKFISETSLAWHSSIEKKDIGWLLEKGKLFFVTGTWKDGKWKKKRRNIVASNITSLQFVSHKNRKFITSIKCILKTKTKDKIYTFEREMVIRNRLVS